MNPTDPTAAIEAANFFYWRAEHVNDGLVDVSDKRMADFILTNKDALLSLPTPFPTAKTAAEVAGIPHAPLPRSGLGEIRAPVRVVQLVKGGWSIVDACGDALAFFTWKPTLDLVAAALNAPAPAPVAGDGGLFEGGDWVSTDVHSRALKPHAQHWFRCVKEGWKFDPKVGTFWGLHHYEGKPVNYTEIWCDRHGNPLAVPTPGAGDAGGEVGK